MTQVPPGRARRSRSRSPTEGIAALSLAVALTGAAPAAGAAPAPSAAPEASEPTDRAAGTPAPPAEELTTGRVVQDLLPVGLVAFAVGAAVGFERRRRARWGSVPIRRRGHRRRTPVD